MGTKTPANTRKAPIDINFDTFISTSCQFNNIIACFYEKFKSLSEFNKNKEGTPAVRINNLMKTPLDFYVKTIVYGEKPR
jgi:hypothetical protein